jgi:hypothetical protein
VRTRGRLKTLAGRGECTHPSGMACHRCPRLPAPRHCSVRYCPAGPLRYARRKISVCMSEACGQQASSCGLRVRAVLCSAHVPCFSGGGAGGGSGARSEDSAFRPPIKRTIRLYGTTVTPIGSSWPSDSSWFCCVLCASAAAAAAAGGVPGCSGSQRISRAVKSSVPATPEHAGDRHQLLLAAHIWARQQLRQGPTHRCREPRLD